MNVGWAHGRQTSAMWAIRLLTVCLSGALLLGACLLGENAPGSGVEGQVMIGPMCPVILEGEACPDQPYAVKLEIEDRTGRVIARSSSDEKGRFRVPVRPGEYLLIPVPSNPGGPPSAAPIPFQVEEGKWTNLTVLMDSGIR